MLLRYQVSQSEAYGGDMYRGAVIDEGAGVIISLEAKSWLWVRMGKEREKGE